MDRDAYGLEGEAAAVFAVILAETQAFYDKDFAAMERCWAHEPYVRRLGWWTRGGVTDRWGWDEIGGRSRRLMEDNPEPNFERQKVRYENLVVRVSGDMAYATFDQYSEGVGEPDMDMPGCSRESRVLERQNGEWRLVYHTYVHQTAEPARAPMYRLDKDGNVSWMNHSAELELKTHGALLISGRRLKAANSADNAKLRAAIAEAASRDASLDGGRAAIPIVLEPMDSDDIRVCWVLTEGSGSGAVIVSINNLTFAQDRLDAAAIVFGLSPAQQRIVEMIAAGRDLTTSAGQLGISINTARTHLQRIFEKTGVRSQLALVRTLLSVARPE